MQFSRSGDAVQVIRITGPAHNLLRLEFGVTSGAVQVRNLDQSGSARLQADEVEREVLRGVAEANASSGNKVSVRAIDYVASDTPPASIYCALARALVQHAFKGKQEKRWIQPRKRVRREIGITS